MGINTAPQMNPNKPQDALKAEWHPAWYFLIFLTITLAPRLALILGGVSYADDWEHTHVPHLDSYRPLAAFELFFIQSAFNADYLMSIWPKLLAGLYYAGSATMLMLVLAELGVNKRLFTLLFIAAFSHPAFNELILWGVLSSSATATFIATAGIYLVYMSYSLGIRGLGLIFMSMGSLSNQMLSILGISMWLLEACCPNPKINFLRPARVELIIRVLMVGLPPLFGLTAILVMSSFYEFSDFANRTVSLETAAGTTWINDKFYVFSNAYANLYQAPLSFLAGTEAALGAFRYMIALPVLLLILLLLAGESKSRSLLLSCLVPVLFLCAFAPLLATSATPTGFRIMGTAIVLVCAGAIVSLQPLWRRTWGASIITVASIALIGLHLLTTAKDMGVRAQAWQQDLALLSQAESSLLTTTTSAVTFCFWRATEPVPASDLSVGILVSYNRANTSSYSIWASQFLPYFLSKRIPGLGVQTIDEPSERCEAACAQTATMSFGPYKLVKESLNSETFVCQ
ncbi:MAG: hypothetical protein AAF431_09200 [Pseudomonadota bacterium]